ncbi:MAG: hypothetical protein WCB36_03495 [Burkholderiales bacterium]
MHGNLRNNFYRIKGSVGKPILWIVAAICFGVTMAIKTYNSGASNFGYILCMSIAAVVAIALVDPDKFSGERREPGDYSKELKELRERQKMFKKVESLETKQNKPESAEK